MTGSTSPIAVRGNGRSSTTSCNELSSNIKKIGIKKPISVAIRTGADKIERYLLVNGEGRLQTVKSLGKTHIPAIIVEVTDDEAYLMRLTESTPREKYSPLKVTAILESLRDKGFGTQKIAIETGLSVSFIEDMLTLLERFEEQFNLIEMGGTDDASR